LLLRFRQYIVYPVQLFAALASRRLRVYSSSHQSESGTGTATQALNLNCNDVCVVSTNTFYAPLIATYLHPNVVHLVYDLFPEAMIHSGKWQEGTFKVKVIRWITKQTLQRSKTNVFLGERLKDYVESIHGPVENAAIIAVGADQALFVRSPKERRTSNVERSILNEDASILNSNSELERESCPTILYCGNFGNMHDSETLFDYWRSRGSGTPVALTEGGGKRQECCFYFYCSGPKRAALESARSELSDVLKDSIHLGGGLSQADWIAVMESADVALVTMSPGSETVVMPSKTYSAMMAGQAILAIAPENSDLVDLIKVADCGWWVEPGDVAGLEAALDVIDSDPELLLNKRENAFNYAHTHLGQDSLAREWERAFLNL